jgi:hypothetical protein
MSFSKPVTGFDIDVPTTLTCFNCKNRGYTPMGLGCKAFPNGIPDQVKHQRYTPDWENHDERPCKQFEYEPLNTKYSWGRAVYVGVIYLISFWCCLEAEDGWISAMAMFLFVILWYEYELHAVKKQRAYYAECWRDHILLLQEQKEN